MKKEEEEEAVFKKFQLFWFQEKDSTFLYYIQLACFFLSFI